MKKLLSLLGALVIASGAQAQTPRKATNADIIASLLNPPAGGIVAPLPSALIPFGTTTGTVADGGLLASLFTRPVAFGATVTLAADPVSALQAATKQYVDAHAGGGGGRTSADGVAAAGSSQAGATVLTANFTRISAGSGGVVAPVFTTGVTNYVANDTTSPIDLYPPPNADFYAVPAGGGGATALATNAPVSIAPGVVVTIDCLSTTIARVF